MVYKYKDPLEQGYNKFKLSRKEYNGIFKKQGTFDKTEAYYSENHIRIDKLSSTLGKIVVVIGFPLWLIIEGVGSFKEICEEISDIFHEKERGKFVSYDIPKYTHTGKINKRFEKLEEIYKRDNG